MNNGYSLRRIRRNHGYKEWFRNNFSANNNNALSHGSYRKTKPNTSK